MLKGTPFKAALMAQTMAALLTPPDAQPYHEEIIEALSPKEPEAFPMRLSCDKDSPYYKPQVAARLGIEFEGAKRRNDVREYCIEDPDTGRGWVRLEAKLPNGKPRIERGRYVTVTKRGIIKPYWQ